MNPSFSFNKEQFNRLFPFHFIVNRKLEVISFGQSLAKLYEISIDRPFGQLFTIPRPFTEITTLDDLIRLQNQLVVLELIQKRNIKLRGQFEYLEETGEILFVGSPWFGSMEQVRENELVIDDFARHDPLIDLLHVLKSQEITNEDLKQLISTINQQKNDLKKANQAIHDIALFPMQNPDPLIRIDMEGEILTRNPAAEMLTSYEYENKEYDPGEFFRLLISKIDPKVERWSFETKFGSRSYSFFCRSPIKEGYINLYGRDITEQKEYEEKLKRLSLVASVNENGVLFTLPDGKINWANEGFCRLTGYSLNEVLGKTSIELCKGPLTDKIALDKVVDAFLKGTVFSTEIIYYRKDGSWFWGRSTSQPIKNEKGEITEYFGIIEDFSLEKISQQKLKEYEERLKIALSNVGDNFWEHDFRTGKTYFSNPHNNLLGFDIDENTDTAALWLDRVHPDDKKLLQDNDDQYRAGLIDHHVFEYRVISRDGHSRWVLDRGMVTEQDEQKKPLRTIGTHIDITRQKEIEIELSQRVGQFQSLSENIPGVIYEYEFRKDGTDFLRYVSPAVEKIFGIKPEDFYQYQQYIHPDDLPQIISKNRQSRETLKPFYHEARLIIPGREMIWHSVSSAFSYYTSDGSAVYTGFMLDITNRKIGERKLEEQRKFYEDILNNTPADIAVFSPSHEYLFVNPMGIKDKELRQWIIGKRDEDYCAYRNKPLAIAEARRKTFNQVVSTKSPSEWEEKLQSPGGEEKYILRRLYPVLEREGKVILVIGYGIDITERKKLEKNLIEARELAESSVIAKQSFLANMSHEIRTPMNAIIGMANQLNKTRLDANQQFYLDTIHSAADNLLIIINNILDLSKIESGELSLEQIGFEPKRVVERVMQVMMHKAEEKGLSLINSFFDNNLSNILIGDPYRLNQVLLNLVSNALKFTEAGSVDIRCRLIQEEDTRQIMEITVTDTGIGMEESFTKNIFQKFQQEDETVTRRFGGTGLGMSICKELIDLMGGTIQVKSKKGAGTSVTFAIPFRKGSLQNLPLKTPNVLNTEILLGKKILVTDDNEMNRLVASMILKYYGATIEEAVNGREACDKLIDREFDLVLMDIQMPEMDGLEATRLIRKRISRKLPVIALTALALKGDEKKFLKAGMNDYLSKPFEENKLLAVVSKWLGKTEITYPEDRKQAAIHALYDLSKLQDIAKGNQAFIHKMIGLFIEQGPLSVQEIREAYAAGDFLKVKKVAHRLKPSIDNLEIVSLKNEIRLIEKNAEAYQTSGQLETLIAKLDQVVHEVTTSLRTRIE